MSSRLPDIPESESTPLVRQLLDLVGHLQNRVQELEDEILRFKGLKTRPIIAQSPLEVPPRPPRDPGQKRPGSAKRPKSLSDNLPQSGKGVTSHHNTIIRLTRPYFFGGTRLIRLCQCDVTSSQATDTFTDRL